MKLMSRKLREEFQLGNDTIGDKVCKNADEYYASFIEDLAFPSTEQYAEETLKPLLMKHRNITSVRLRWKINNLGKIQNYQKSGENIVDKCHTCMYNLKSVDRREKYADTFIRYFIQ